MNHNYNYNIFASHLSEDVQRIIAGDIYSLLTESREALEYAEQVKAESGIRNLTIEDILWEVAYHNAEHNRYTVKADISIKLERN